MCGKNLSKQTVSTIGEQKRFNYALQPMSFEAFREMVASDQPEAPEYFVYDAIKNRQERTDLESAMKSSLQSLSLEQVLQMKDHAQIVDVRDGIDFEGAHLIGSVNIGLQGKYATWCGSILNHDEPIIVVAEQGNEEEAIMRLGRIGFDNVAGYLQGGMSALDKHPEWIGTIERITANALAELLDAPKPPVVIDVRSEKEWKDGHLPSSVNIPLPHLRERIQEVAADRSVVVHCEGGYRSAIAASLLSQAGRTNVLDLVGGIKAWNATQLPTAHKGAIGTTCNRSTGCSK